MKIHYTDNLAQDIEDFLADEEKALEGLPICAECGEPIQQEDAVHIDGRWYCDYCIDSNREYVEKEVFV